MDEATPNDSSDTGSFTKSEEQRQEMKDFVYKHLKMTTDHSEPVICDPVDCSIEETVSPTKTESKKKFNCKNQQGAVFSGKILSFGCSVCKDDITYSPNDLLKHFQGAHKGTLPTYPCDLCGFVTNEFPVLQRHRIRHRNTLVACEICNDGVQYSLLLLTRHYIMRHSLNGHFYCDKCEFTTVDAGTFVQHIHRHNENRLKCLKCCHVSANDEEHQKHVKVHSGSLPAICPVCGYCTTRSEYLAKHMFNVHGEETDRKRVWRAMEDGSPADSAAGLKLLLKKSPSVDGEAKESKWKSKLNCHSGSLPNKNGGCFSSEENEDFEDSEQQSEETSLSQECDNGSASDTNHNNPNGLTVLMVKNKISLPPNCTTKVIGFKVVDGKKHLVLKVIPTGKVEPSTQNLCVKVVGSAERTPDKSKYLVENGECCNSDCSPCPPMAITHQDDIMAVKVKIEEEETSVSSFPPEQAELERSPKPLTSDSVSDRTSVNADISSPLRSKRGQKSSPKAASQNVSRSRGTAELETDNGDNAVETDDQSLLKNASENTVFTVGEIKRLSEANNHLHKGTNRKTQTTPPSSEPEPPSDTSIKETETVANRTQSAPNQEVFSFHNYSKETCSILPNTTQTLDSLPEMSADNEGVGGQESAPWSLTLSDSPPPCFEGGDVDAGKASDVEVDECVDNVEDPSTEDETPESVLRDFNIIKVEEDSIPVSRNPPENRSSSASLGRIVEEHSDAIITHQLNKERTENSSASNESVQPTKTTLRILQTPEGKKQMLLQTAESQYAIPVQLKGSPGFKLITTSTSPQIKVSYMKPGFGRAGNPTGLTASQNGSVVASASAGGAGKTLLSASGVVGNTSSHYIINSTGLKGPVVLSSTAHGTGADKSVTTHPNCYLVQRSLPIVQAPGNAGFKLASSQVPVGSRPVLAMPVNTAEKSNSSQTGRQAFLVRYISQAKSGILVNNSDGKTVTMSGQPSDGVSSKVVLKIVTPTSGLLTSVAPSSTNQPLFLATRPQTQCFLVSSNKSGPDAPAGTSTLIPLPSAAQKRVVSCLLPSQPGLKAKVKPYTGEKLTLVPRPIRPPSQRKRRRKQLFDELPVSSNKARRLAGRVAAAEKETPVLWRPAAANSERVLRLSPFSPLQPVKCPRRHQPVVVLNHPDADIPEVAGIMRAVSRHRGAVAKVALSRHTVRALSELGQAARAPGGGPRPRPRARAAQSCVRERFLLKLKLRKRNRRKYEVVRSGSVPGPTGMPSPFHCWFCGRVFSSQEAWVGHGQRHLMEATRDWNKLF